VTKEIIERYFRGNYKRFFRKYLSDAKLYYGSEGKATCPFHNDSQPSLCFNNQSGTFYCHGCGAKGDIFNFYGMKNHLDIRLEFPKIIQGIAKDFGILVKEQRQKIVKTYDYKDAMGRLLYQVCRYEPKDFKQRRPDGKDRWVWNLKGIAPVIYRLPEVLKAQEIIVVEGEKDADNLFDLGFTATTSPMGAGKGKWRAKYSEYLRGKSVVLCPDNDRPGRQFMDSVGEALQGIAASVKILLLPDIAEKEDVSDFIARQPNKEAAFECLCIMIESAPPWKPQEKGSTTLLSSNTSCFQPTDLGNSERLIHYHGQNIRFCYPWGKWLSWTGKQWRIDESGEIERMAKKTVRLICKEVKSDHGSEKAKEIYRHAGRSEAESRIKAMISLARMEVPIMPNDLDLDPYLFNLQNGTINLKTGELLPHRSDNLISKIIPASYEPTSDCPTWKMFLDRIFKGKLALIEYCRRIVGYSLTGDTSEQCFFLLWGTGSNGKSTFLETIRALTGDYSQQADFSTFLAKKNDGGASNDLAALKGARVVCASEAGASRSLNEALIKQITGGEAIRARFLYGEYFEFRPEFKLFLATNHKPRIRDTDNGIWRRVRLIPFEVTIPKEEQDSKLLEKLKGELPGILNWALEGCREWIDKGLNEPDEVLAATTEYRTAEDAIGGFIEDRCILSSTARIKTCDLKKAYKEWCEVNEEETIHPRTFSSLLESRGCKPGRDWQGRYWEGIELKTMTP